MFTSTSNEEFFIGIKVTRKIILYGENLFINVLHFNILKI